MLTTSGIGVPANGSHMGGFGDVGRNVLNNNIDVEGFLASGTSSSMVARDSSIITFSPLKDAPEHQRRVRNNAILAKIQELEATASVQAARSERLRMMREEYESLVRKYASSRKWNLGAEHNSNGHLNESGDHHRHAYPSFEGQNELLSTITSSGGGTQPLLLTTIRGRGTSPALQPLPDGNRSFSTTGVNTDITGPVRPELMEGRRSGVKNDDLQEHNVSNLIKVKVVDTESQTESTEPHQMRTMTIGPRLEKAPEASQVWGSQFPDLDRQQSSNQGGIVEQDEKQVSVQDKLHPGRKLPVQMEVMMFDEEDGNEEKSLQGAERKQRRHFHQLRHPKAEKVDDTISPNSTSPTQAENPTITTSNNSENPHSPRRRHHLSDKVERKKAVARSVKVGESGNGESSRDTTTTLSLPPRRDEYRSKSGKDDYELSLTDSTSMFQSHQRQRKLLLQQLSSRSGIRGVGESCGENKGKSDVGGDQQDAFNDSSRGGAEEEISVMRLEGGDKRRHDDGDKEEDDDLRLCSTPTAGATSESLGDSIMDSMQKTPDTLPKDDSELQGIAEANEEDEKLEEIELDESNKVLDTFSPDDEDDDDVENDFVERIATAGEARQNKRILSQSRVNDKNAETEGVAYKDARNEIKELELHEQINDAEEIRSNNLSSSKLDANEEAVNSAHAYNLDEGKVRSSRSHSPAQLDASHIASESFELEESVVEAKSGQGQNGSQALFGESGEFTGRQEELSKSQIVMQSDTREVNESIKEKTMIPMHAQSANLSSHQDPPSSSESTSSAGGSLDNAGNGGQNENPKLRKNSYQILSRRDSLTGSSSTASSRQPSFDETTHGGRAGEETKEPNESNKDSAPSHQGSPSSSNSVRGREHGESGSLTQAAHKRHHQLEQQVKRGREGEERTPVGAETSLEHLSTTSTVLRSGVTTQPTTNGSAKVVGGGTEKLAGTAGKSLKDIVLQLPHSPSTSSPSSRRGQQTNNGSGSGAGGNGTGQTGANYIRSPKAFKSPVMPKPGQTPPTVVSGPTGALNTARRLKLKLNYDDSESDSSEISPMKALPGSVNLTANQGSPGSLQHEVSVPPENANESQKGGESSKKNDDDFDEFFDI